VRMRAVRVCSPEICAWFMRTRRTSRGAHARPLRGREREREKLVRVSKLSPFSHFLIVNKTLNFSLSLSFSHTHTHTLSLSRKNFSLSLSLPPPPPLGGEITHTERSKKEQFSGKGPSHNSTATELSFQVCMYPPPHMICMYPPLQPRLS
jgi:hypothetical protein